VNLGAPSLEQPGIQQNRPARHLDNVARARDFPRRALKGDAHGGASRDPAERSGRFRATRKDHDDPLRVLRQQLRLPPASAPLVQQVCDRIFVVPGPTAQPDDDGLIFFHLGEDTRLVCMTTTPPFANLTVLRHPLISHKITLLRDRTTPTRIFRELVSEIAMLMAYEATADLPLEPREVETPLERTVGTRVAGKKIVLIPILRAGLGMVDGILRLIPSARVGHVGLYRDHDSLRPVDYYFRIPGDAAKRDFLVLDPMLATGGSAVAAISRLKAAGAHRIRFLCLVAAPPGVSALLRTHPDVPVMAAALDRELNANGYILPGLGDAGDRLFGTR